MANTSMTNALAQAMLGALNTELTNGLVRIYAGAQPADADTALTGQTLLAELTLGATPFVLSDGGGSAVATCSSVTGDTNADATGVATFFRAYKTGGVVAVIDGDVSTVAAGTGDLQLDNTSIDASDTVNISTWIITLPE